MRNFLPLLFSMNLFFLHENPVIAAQLQADVHVVKMILETLQMICTALHLCRSPFIWPFFLYKCTHKNHPSTKWVRYSVENYMWALNHGIALCEEYTRRYKKIHKCHKYYMSLTKLPAPHFADLSIDRFDTNKLSFKSIPKTCQFVAIAIADDIFHECAKFNENKELLAIETYISYYMHKMRTMKRKIKWYKSETPPLLFINVIDMPKPIESREQNTKIKKRKIDELSTQKKKSKNQSQTYDKPKRQVRRIVRYQHEFVL